VPSHAGHSTSALASFGLGLFIISSECVVNILLQARRSLTSVRRHPLNPRHVVVGDRTCFSVIPRNGDLTPRRCDNRAKVRCRAAPTNTVADFECSGLVAGHSTFPEPSHPAAMSDRSRVHKSLYPATSATSTGANRRSTRSSVKKPPKAGELAAR
jgi:hypothetical protein